MQNGPENEGENRPTLRPVQGSHGKESIISDHQAQPGDRLRGLQYVPPEGSTEAEPPYDSPEITRWMVLDGRRVQRHASLSETWRVARDRILKASVWMLIAFCVLIITACAFFAGVYIAVGHLLSRRREVPLP